MAQRRGKVKFGEGDRVNVEVADGDMRPGRVITWNNDNPRHVLLLVKLDDPIATDEDGSTFRTEWFEQPYVTLIESGIDWVLRRRDEILDGEPTEAALNELLRLRTLHDRIAGVDPQAEIRAARAREIAESFGTVYPAGGPGHD